MTLSTVIQLHMMVKIIFIALEDNVLEWKQFWDVLEIMATIFHYLTIAMWQLKLHINSWEIIQELINKAAISQRNCDSIT